MTRLQRRAAAVVIALAALAGTGAIGAGMATADGTPGTQTFMTKVRIIDATAPSCGNQIEADDHNLAPMFWVNCGGTGSGGEPVCVFGLHLQPLACIGGPWGNYGGQPAVTLYLGGRTASLDFSQLLWLDAWLARRGIR